jgi:hypothetical protein
MERWPTIADLAKADIEEVNAAWRGLGYYRRARSLLKGAQTVMGDSKYKGASPRPAPPWSASDVRQLTCQVDCQETPGIWRRRSTGSDGILLEP